MKEGYDVIETLLLPDGEQPLKHQLMRLAIPETGQCDLYDRWDRICRKRCDTQRQPAVCDRMAMGIADAIRQYSLSITGRAIAKPAVSVNSRKRRWIELIFREAEGCKRESGVCICHIWDMDLEFCVAQMVNVAIADNS